MPLIPNLKRARERSLLTQEALAKKSGVAEVTIARAETGHGVQFTTIRRLAKALDVDPTTLMDEDAEGKAAARNNQAATPDTGWKRPTEGV